MCLMRSIRAALPAFFLLSSVGASAGDFSVTYAIDASVRNDVVIETCDYDKLCEINARRSGAVDIGAISLRVAGDAKLLAAGVSGR